MRICGAVHPLEGCANGDCRTHTHPGVRVFWICVDLFHKITVWYTFVILSLKVWE
jgi:hypothetical protein